MLNSIFGYTPMGYIPITNELISNIISNFIRDIRSKKGRQLCRP
jgi:hypothetical protein